MARYVDVQVDLVVKESDSELAYLFEVDGESVWVPKSQLEKPDDILPGQQNIVVSMKKWLADEKGFDYE